MDVKGGAPMDTTNDAPVIDPEPTPDEQARGVDSPEGAAAQSAPAEESTDPAMTHVPAERTTELAPEGVSLPGPPPHPSTVPWVALASVALIVSLVAGAAAGFLAGRFGAPASTREDASAPSATASPRDEPVASAAAAALPSVVNIDVTGDASSSDDDSMLPQDHPDVPVVGNGSGVAFQEASGGGTLILTNQHVVADAKTIVVTDASGERHRAKLVGQDEETDIAVLEVDADVPTIAIGDSEQVVVGQLVIAIGSPFGLQHSVTAGVISAIHRSIPDETTAEGRYPLIDVIQTDAAINPGNSGGALVDREGRLIGIPTAIYSNTGADSGIGFVVPVKTALRVAREIIETGRAKHPFLGIVGQTVTAELAAREKLPVEEGALVVEVTEGSEAEKAGLQPDDIIVKLDETPIRSMDDLLLAVRRKAVGDTVRLTLWRDGERIEISMKVGVKPDKP